MKTSELIGPALDWAVAKCEGFRTELNYQYTDDHKFNGWWQCGPNHWQPLCKYSTDWEQGGPIIEREVLNGLQLGRKTTGAMKFCCYAEYQGHMWEQLRKHYGPTPLIAAMRTYIASKLGDEVQIPEELQDVR